MGTPAVPGAGGLALGTAHRSLPSPASCPGGKLRHGGCREIRAEPGVCSPSQKIAVPSPGPAERAGRRAGNQPRRPPPAPPRRILGLLQMVPAASPASRSPGPNNLPFVWQGLAGSGLGQGSWQPVAGRGAAGGVSKPTQSPALCQGGAAQRRGSPPRTETGPDPTPSSALPWERMGGGDHHSSPSHSGLIKALLR